MDLRKWFGAASTSGMKVTARRHKGHKAHSLVPSTLHCTLSPAPARFSQAVSSLQLLPHQLPPSAHLFPLPSCAPPPLPRLHLVPSSASHYIYRSTPIALCQIVVMCLVLLLSSLLNLFPSLFLPDLPV